MKKLLVFILTFLLCLNVCSCNKQSENFEAPANFYYLQAQDSLDLSKGVICCEVRETKSFETNLVKLLNTYFQGPITDTCSSPFPTELYVVSIVREDGKVILTLSDSFAKLDGLNLTVSATCISMTLFELIECDLVELRSERKLTNGKESIIISRELLYLQDVSHDGN